LHNIVFAEEGCVLGVIGVPERVNLWHLGICEALGHKAAYTQAYLDDSGQRVGSLLRCPRLTQMWYRP
jgi:hypothetical protein